MLEWPEGFPDARNNTANGVSMFVEQAILPPPKKAIEERR